MPKPRPEKPPRPLGPCPTQASLHEAALRHLARYATTQANLVRVLDRRIFRWQHASGAAAEVVAPARAAARTVVDALVASGAVDDAGFAQARVRRLVRAGRSRRAVSAHLAAKGVDADIADGALPDPQAEFMAAVTLARRRRLGPFRPPGADVESRPDDHGRTLAIFARAGFPRDVAERALRLEPDEAADLLATLRQG